jgi:hypothetical protein
MRHIRDVTSLIIIYIGLVVSGCSKPADRRSQDVTIVRGVSRQSAVPFTEPSTPPAKIMGNREDGELQQLAAIAALRDADPYRLANVDLRENVAEADEAVGM